MYKFSVVFSGKREGSESYTHVPVGSTFRTYESPNFRTFDLARDFAEAVLERYKSDPNNFLFSEYSVIYSESNSILNAVDTWSS